MSSRHNDGLINWSHPANVDAMARLAMREPDVALVCVVMPGVLDRIVEIERTEGEQMNLEVDDA